MKTRLLTAMTAVVVTWSVSPATAALVTLQNATATLTQSGFVSSQTIDGNLGDNAATNNGWAIVDFSDGSSSSPQTMAWETASDLTGGATGTYLTFQLYQQFLTGGPYDIGRFRLSATTEPRGDFADGSSNGGDVTTTWTVLVPVTKTGANPGTTFTPQPDNSILVGGTTQLGSEIYTITAITHLVGITGFRLEVLADGTLPTSGPGRTGDGNFVLSEFVVTAIPEPSSFLMLLCGAVSLLRLNRRQSNGPSNLTRCSC